MIRAGASALILAALTPACLGQAMYLSQDRWITVIDCMGNGLPPESIAATGFDPFNEALLTGFTNTSAGQTSVLEPWIIKANGYGNGDNQNGCCGNGKSHFAVTFVLDQPTPWKVDGYVGVGQGGNASWKLTGPGVNLLFQKKDPEYGYFTLNESGVLDPGEYAITVEVDSSCIYSGGSASYNFHFAFGDLCEPDCDGSGSLDIDDFICFQTLFVLGDLKADCDGSGVLSISDFICFQSFYAIGC